MTSRRSKERLASLGVQVAFVLLAMVLLRWASLRYVELDREGRSSFDLFDLLFGWRGTVVMLIVALAAVTFTLAMRWPLSPGFRWGPAIWGLLAFSLTYHTWLYFRWADWGFVQRDSLDPLTTLLGLDRVTFLDIPYVRWVLAALAGVGLGCAIGRHRVAQTPIPDPAPVEQRAADSPSVHVSG